MQQIASLIYQDSLAQYEADRCLPQRHAIDTGTVGFHALTQGHYPGTRIPEDVLPGVSSLGMFDMPGPQDWGIPPHRNEGVELCYQETGEALLVVDGCAQPMPPGSLSITRPWQLHSMGNPHLNAGRLHWIILDLGVRRPDQDWQWPGWCLLPPGEQDELSRLLRGTEQPVWQASAELSALFRRLSHYAAAPKPEANAARLRIAVNHLLVALLDLLRAQNLVPDPALSAPRRATELFLRELREQPGSAGQSWTLDRMAAHCGMGRSSFSGHCKTLTNRSPIDHLNHCRLQHAARLMRDEVERNITDIAMDCGFSSSQYFSRKFRGEFRTSPREWRKACS